MCYWKVWMLSTVQRWASNSQYWQSYGDSIFRRRALKMKTCKNGLLNFGIYLCFSWPTKEDICSNLSGVNFEAFSCPLKKWSWTDHQFCGNKLLKLIQAIFQIKLVPCNLRWQFENQKDIYLVLQGFNVIHIRKIYGTGPFLTTGDIITSCKV